MIKKPEYKEEYRHLHGYHGSDAGFCIYCGTSDSEMDVCKKRCKEEYKKKVKQYNKLIKIANILKKLNRKDRNFVIESLSFYNFDFNELKEVIKGKIK